MRLDRRRIDVIAALTVCIAISIGQIGAASTQRTLVEVWTGGDDGLTLGLREALEHALESSPAFTCSYGKKPGTLMVRIPSNVGWQKVGKRTKVLYTVEFKTIDDRMISTGTGSCWKDALAMCADRIVRDAKIVARKIH